MSATHPFFREREANEPKKAPVAQARVVVDQPDDDEGSDEYHDALYDPVVEEDDKFDYSTLKEKNVPEVVDHGRAGSGNSDEY